MPRQLKTPDALLLSHLLAKLDATEPATLTATLAEECRKALRDATLVAHNRAAAEALDALLSTKLTAGLAMKSADIGPTMLAVARRYLRDKRPAFVPDNEEERRRRIGAAALAAGIEPTEEKH